MSGSVSQALSLQGRVIWALALREIHGKHGKSRLGYLWQVIKTGFGVAVFWWIRSAAGAPAHAIPLPLFLLMGFIPWFIFAETVKVTTEAVRTNKALLTFAQVTPLDLFASSALVVWVTEVVVMGFYLVLIGQMGYAYRLLDPIHFSLALLAVGFFSLGVGLILTALTIYLPVVEKLVPMALRILFFTSGVFFEPTKMGKYSDFIMWNPVTNIIELMRGGFIHPAPASYIKTVYLLWVTLSVLAVGLLLERYIRPKHEMS